VGDRPLQPLDDRRGAPGRLRQPENVWPLFPAGSMP
jgi:hypothetical protein